MAGGRPPAYSDETRAEICRRIADGESLRSICASEGMPTKTTVLDWLFDDAVFSAQYARAREAQAEHMLDEIIEIADDSMLDTVIDPETGAERTNHEVVARAKLRVDARKWAMSKMAPKKYGDKIHQTLSGLDGGPIRTSREMTDDELAAIAAGSGAGTTRPA